MTADEALDTIDGMMRADASAKRAAVEAVCPTPSADDFLLSVLRINGPETALDYVREVGRSAFSPLALDEVFRAAA